jgi:hypothetical protein
VGIRCRFYRHRQQSLAALAQMEAVAVGARLVDPHRATAEMAGGPVEVAAERALPAVLAALALRDCSSLSIETTRNRHR